jgi:hypothetical protein
MSLSPPHQGLDEVFMQKARSTIAASIINVANDVCTILYGFAVAVGLQEALGTVQAASEQQLRVQLDRTSGTQLKMQGRGVRLYRPVILPELEALIPLRVALI